MGARGIIVAACGMLAACGSDDAGESPAVNVAASPTPVASSAAAPSQPKSAPLREWIIGTWSFDTSCATDFLIRYDADGRLDNAGEVGSWRAEGDRLTETVTERLEQGGDAPEKLARPIVRTYAVRRTDSSRGIITFENRDVPIQRC
jgi:hypothetical protein